MSLDGAAPAATTPAGLLRQLIATGGGEIVNRVAQLACLSLMGWVLGVEGVAQVGVAWSLTAIALSVVQSGPDLAGIVAITSPDKAAPVAASLMRLKALLALASVPLLLAAQWLSGRHDEAALSQLALQTVAMALGAQSQAWLLRNLGRAFDQSLVRLVQALGCLALLAGLLAVWRSPLAFPVADGLSALAAWMLGQRRLRAALTPPVSATPRFRQLAMESLKLGGMCALSNAMCMTPTITIARWANAADISYVAGVMRLLLGLIGLLHLCLHALYPHLARLYDTDRADGARAATTLGIQAALLAAVGAAVLAATAEWSVPLLLGPPLAGAVPLFQALIPALVPVALGAPLIYALMARRETGVLTAIHAVITIAMLVGCTAAFSIEPTAWGAVWPVHGVLWLYTILVLAACRRRGLAAWPEGGWRRLLAPGNVLRRLSQP